MPKLDSKTKPGDVLPKREIDPAFGDAVRAARKKSGISLTDLAGRVGISTSYLSQIERAIMQPPRAEIIVALANELRLNSSELLAKAGMTDLTVLELFRRNPQLVSEMQEAFADVSDNTRKALLPIITQQMMLDILKVTLSGPPPSPEQWEGLRRLVFGASGSSDNETKKNGAAR